MYQLTVTDVDTDVVGLAVMIVIEEDQVSLLQSAQTDFPSAVHLHVCSVRETDSVILSVAIHREAGTVKT